MSTVALLSVAVALGTTLAQAQAASTEAAVELRRESAKAQFRRGAALFKSERYESAIRAFLEADKLSPSPALSFNLALAFDRLGDVSGALRWYRDYLRRRPNPPNAAEVNARISELARQLGRKGVQQLTVLSTPAGAQVAVDGHALGSTPLTVELALGSHDVQLQLSGYRASSRRVLLSDLTPAELSSMLERLPAHAKASRAPAPRANAVNLHPAVDRPRRFGVVPWIVAGAGAVGLGGAVGFELVRRSHEEDAAGARSQLDFQREIADMKSAQTQARVWAGVGAALAAAGTLLVVFNERQEPVVRVGINCALTGCGAVAKGTF
jgi:tetratricopeptide (TPR) repeat protein